MIITQTVPICPNCKAMLCKRHQDNNVFYFCYDCMKIYKVIGTGDAEIELVITDKEEEKSC